jgi:predicted NBD/HSP70 family sugar kinase
MRGPDGVNQPFVRLSVRIIHEMPPAPRAHPSPAIPPLLKELNARTVLQSIRDGAPISRAEISRRAGISKPTVSLALQTLLDAGLVREAADSPRGPRYGATFFEPVHEAALVLGLDLGARFLRGAICDLRGAIRARQDVELGSGGTRTDLSTAVEAIPRLREALVSASGLDGSLLDRAVVGVPGVVRPDVSRVELATNVAGLEGTDLHALLEPRLGLPVTLENDINLAAIGEQWLGIARGVEDFVFMSIGTGLGAGVVLRGELQRGRHGAAGELDLVGAGREEIDPCAGAVSDLSARLARGRETVLAEPYDPRAVFGAARSGDPVAREVVAEEARRIALHIAPIAAVADVGLIVLGGGVGANGDLLLEPVRGLLSEWLPYPPRVEVSALGEAAVLSGALSVGLTAALDDVLARRFVRA